MFFLGCRTRCSFCFICYMFCLFCHGVSGGWGVGYFANMSVIEHKRVTCCALCFCGLSCHGVSGGWGGGLFCKHVCDRTQTRYMLCSVFLWSLLSRGFGGGGGGCILQTCL